MREPYDQEVVPPRLAFFMLVLLAGMVVTFAGAVIAIVVDLSR